MIEKRLALACVEGRREIRPCSVVQPLRRQSVTVGDASDCVAEVLVDWCDDVHVACSSAQPVEREQRTADNHDRSAAPW